MARIPGLSASAGSRELRAGDVICTADHTFHYIQYVNSAGAFAIPLSKTIVREINGHTVNFAAEGRSISSWSFVDIVDPLTMGGSSPEYSRYVKMVAAAREVDMAKKLANIDLGPEAHGVPVGDFDTSTDGLFELGHLNSYDLPATMPDGSDSDMAKKASAKKAKANGKARKEKAPKKVRLCACGCGGETTGYFVPGHDSKLHGWIKKLEDGRITKGGKDAKSGEQIVPASTLHKLGLVAKGDGFKSTTPHFYKD